MFKIFLVLLILGLSGLLNAQMFSPVQGAQVLAKNSHELSVMSGLYFIRIEPLTYYDGHELKLNYGFQYAYGLNGKSEVRASVNAGSGFSEWKGGVKFKITRRNRISFYVPLAVSNYPIHYPTYDFIYPPAPLPKYGTSIQPTMLLSLPLIGKNIQFSPSASYLGFFNGNDYVNINLGFGISIKPDSWFIRLEWGNAYEFHEASRYQNYSVGFSYSFNNPKE